jgi:CHASE2 domain-containing sensor protein
MGGLAPVAAGVRRRPVFGWPIVKHTSVIKRILPGSALIGAALAVVCGLALRTPLGDSWVNASYDSLYRFGARAAASPIAFILMDNDSHEILGQPRTSLWDRKLHADLLDKLTADGAGLVVFDVFFQETNYPATDARLADAIRTNGKVVLMAEVSSKMRPLDNATIEPPLELFRAAAAGWGIGQAAGDTGALIRQHWPFYALGGDDIHSLAWAAAHTLDPKLGTTADQQWLRYYGRNGPGEKVPYYLALTNSPGYFREKIVFIGNWPRLPRDPGSPDDDKFRTPYTAQTGEAVGGVEIMATTFLNLLHDEGLRRLPPMAEIALLVLAGLFIGGGLCRLKPLYSLLAAAGIFLAVMLIAVTWSYYRNHWFPWLLVAGGQLPCALAWAWVSQSRRVAHFLEPFPGYTVVDGPFGEGAYGKVWLVRNTTGQLQALKEIQRANFREPGPYEREFNGLKHYKPVSSEHPGLLHIDHVNANEAAGYFYYVMELGDAMDPAWEQQGQPYRPRDLAGVCGRAEGGRLPVRECLRIGIGLLEALDFLHQHGLVHRDIKPSNIIFVNGRPKLADVGLVRQASPDSTYVGTEDYMPPPPEPPGSKVADIYALGKVLYVISTGKSAKSFAELSTTLVDKPEFLRLNEIIRQACQPAADQRYPSAAAMLAALRAAQAELDAGGTNVA